MHELATQWQQTFIPRTWWMPCMNTSRVSNVVRVTRCEFLSSSKSNIYHITKSKYDNANSKLYILKEYRKDTDSGSTNKEIGLLHICITDTRFVKQINSVFQSW